MAITKSDTGNSRTLRAALASNAVFSAGSGLLLVLLPGPVNAQLGLDLAWLMPLLGLGLLVFAADLLHQATRPRLASWRALYASAADGIWVLGSLALVALLPAYFSAGGITLVLAVAALVLVMGCWQLIGIHRLHRVGGSGHYRHCIACHTEVPAEAMWGVLRELGAIERYMPDLARSELSGAPGIGAIRNCEDRAGRQWRETCTDWQEGRGFTLRFATEAPDFPFPASAMIGGWEVLPDDRGCTVMVWWELQPRPARAAALIMPLLALKADLGFPKIIATMAAAARGDAKPAAKLPRAGLLPRSC